MKVHIIALSGPSLSGKTELSKMLQKNGCHCVVSVTTRPQRSSEKDGVDYHFITENDFSNLKLVQKTYYNNFYYGVSENEILNNKDKPIIWVVAPSSIAQIENYCLKNDYKLTKIFLSNPEEVLLSRLLNRFKSDNQANTDVYVKRLQSMINHERQWVLDAKNNVHQYDIVLDKFNEENQEEVVNNILNLYKKSRKLKP